MNEGNKFDDTITREEMVAVTTNRSKYNGIPVISVPWAKGSASVFGRIFLGGEPSVSNVNSRVLTLRHEYGHYLQDQHFGFVRTLFGMSLPSVRNYHKRYYMNTTLYGNNYHNQPWELDADIRANISRPTHTGWTKSLRNQYCDYLEKVNILRLIFVDSGKFAKHDFAALGGINQ